MAYNPSKLASDAVAQLTNIVRGLRVNDLNSYVAPDQTVRQDYQRFQDENNIANLLRAATNADFDVQRAQALQDAINAEDTNYANTRSAISEMRRNLIGSGSSGANVGAANATALQALLGLGQQNTQTTTEGLRNINNISRERTAALAQNNVDALNTAIDATKAMYDAANSAYSADRSYAAQGAAQGLGELAAAAENAASQERINTETNQTQERMNNATNATNLRIEQTEKKTKNTNVNKNK